MREDGVDANIDQYQSAPPEGWQLWMEKEIRDSQFVLLVCTETYLRRVMKEDSGKGLGVMWESTIIYQYLYNAGIVNEKFIPIVFGRDNTKYIPIPLQPTTYYDVNSEEDYESLYRRLTDQPHTPKPELGSTKKLAPRERKKGNSGPRVFLAKLPSTDATLFGRDDKLKDLDDAWENPRINVVSLVAWGGVGKTALVNKWLSQMAAENYRGAQRVYGWSFYSQGAAEGRQVSADPFIAAALAWFGDPDPTQGYAWDKGERLAGLIREQRTLLILDGLEPLQNPPPVEMGKIKDPGLTALLRELARQNPGLVVISTRLAVDDLKDCLGNTVIEHGLENLSPEAGAAFLAYLGVDGTDEERREAARDFGGHALALTLLGRYLKVVHGGDIRKRNEIPHIMDEQRQGAHARRVMESYERWLKGKPELDILRLMGLFDRPAEKGALEAVRKKPAIKGLTDSLQKLKDTEWRYAVNDLRDLRLIAQEDPHEPDTLDCHPLLREHFGGKLKAENPEAWREAHGRLYEYYKSSAKEYPDTLEEMAPLFAAVLHGCQAGKYQEAHDEVYFKRIRRKNECFNIKKLGAICSTMSVMSNFFEEVWSKPIEYLRENARSVLLHDAGYCLGALGRLTEAAQPMQAGLDVNIAREDWRNAARDANNLSELTLTIGEVAQALVFAKQSVQFADRSDDSFIQMYNRTTLADALLQAGRLAEAEATFRKAEDMQKERQPKFPLLYSFQGYRYCDLLVSRGKIQDVQRSAGQTLEWAKQEEILPDIALDNLSLGRAHTLTLPSPYQGEGTDAAIYLDLAVDGLRRAERQDFIPLGLLARAEFYRLTGALDKAQKDLDEAFSIATRGGMGLHLADCHLEHARLILAKAPGLRKDEEAREHLKTAKEMIAKMGYHRRDQEVEELEKQLKP